MTHRTPIIGTLAVAALLVASLPGCSTPPPATKGMTADEVKTLVESRRAECPLPDEDLARIGYRLDWVGYPDVGPGEHVTSINIASDIIAIQDSSSTVSALDPTNGSRRWSFLLGSRLVRFSPLVRNGPAVYASSDAELFLLRAEDGNFIQSDSKVFKPRQSFSRISSTAPIVLGNQIVFGSASGEIIGHSTDLGLRRWGFLAKGPIVHSLVRVGDTVAAVTQTGQVVFLDPFSGHPVGTGTTYGSLDTDPIAAGNTLVVASRDQSLYCFDTDGRQIWRFRTPHPLTVQPSSDSGVVYCDLQDQGLTAFNAINGNVLWKSPEAHGTVFASRKGRLLAFDGKTVTVLDRERGDVIDSLNFEYADRFVTDKFADGNLFVVSKSGLVAKLVLR